MRLNPLATVVILSTILLSLAIVSKGQEPADWWKAQRDATAMLIKPKSSIAALAAKLSTTKSENAQDTMFKLCILMRAGMNREAINTLHELKTQWPEINNYQVSSIYYYACDNIHSWDIAKANVEVFAENISEMTLDNRLLKHLLESGWTVEKIDNWFAR